MRRQIVSLQKGEKMSTDSILEAARKAAARAAIRLKIKAVQDKINKARELIAEINKNKISMSSDRTQWSNAYTSRMSSRITSEIVVKGLFRGVMAEVLQRAFPERTKLMNRISGQAGLVTSSAGGQVQKLNEYIDKLEAEKAALYSQLAQI